MSWMRTENRSSSTEMERQWNGHRMKIPKHGTSMERQWTYMTQASEHAAKKWNAYIATVQKNITSTNFTKTNHTLLSSTRSSEAWSLADWNTIETLRQIWKELWQNKLTHMTWIQAESNFREVGIVAPEHLDPLTWNGFFPICEMGHLSSKSGVPC